MRMIINGIADAVTESQSGHIIYPLPTPALSGSGSKGSRYNISHEISRISDPMDHP